MENIERKVISKWNRKVEGKEMEQVVYITTLPNGKKHSVTKHETVK